MRHALCRPVHALAIVLAAATPVALHAAVDDQASVGGVIGSSTAAEGASDEPYLGPGFGGASVSTVVFVDGALSDAVSLGAEASLAGAITGVQRQRAPSGSNTLESRHRDTIVSGVLKLKTAASARVQTAVSGGLGLARRQTDRTGAFTPNVPPFVSRPVTQSLSDTVLATTAGFEAAIAFNRHAGLLALVRVHYLVDDDRQPDGVVQRGVSSLVFRYGVGARVGW